MGKRKIVLEAAKKCGNKSVMNEEGRRKQIYEAVVLISLCLNPAKNRTSFQKYSYSQPLTLKFWSSRSGVAAMSAGTLISAPNLVFMDKLLWT